MSAFLQCPLLYSPGFFPEHTSCGTPHCRTSVCASLPSLNPERRWTSRIGLLGAVPFRLTGVPGSSSLLGVGRWGWSCLNLKGRRGGCFKANNMRRAIERSAHHCTWMGVTGRTVNNLAMEWEEVTERLQWRTRQRLPRSSGLVGVGGGSSDLPPHCGENLFGMHGL